MIITIVLSLLLIGIAFFQVLQGLFSSLIMALLTTLSVAIALNYFEPLGDMLASNLGVYAYGASLLALFVIPLFLLREIFDRTIRGNVVLGLWPDRIGGGLLGTYTAFLMVGILSLVMQLLPWNETMLGWQGYNSYLTTADGATPRWTANFVVSVGQHLSEGPLSVDHPLASVHADLAQEAFAAQNRPLGAAANPPPAGVSLEGIFAAAMPDKPDQKPEGSEEDIARISETAPQNPLLAANEPTRVYVVRTNISSDVARMEKDTWWRVSGTQFRLVGQDDHSYYPVGYLSYSGGWKLNTALEEGGSRVELTKLVVGRPIDVGQSLRVDWVYRLPAKVKPAFLDYRGVQKLPIDTIAFGLPKPLDDKGATLALSAKPREGGVKFDPVGSNHFLKPEGMDASNAMPRNMSISLADPKVLPKELSQLEVSGNQGMKKIVATDAPLATLNSASSTVVGGIRAYNLIAAPGCDIITVHIELDPKQQADMEAIKAKLPQLKPVLLLSDGSKLGHRGMYLEYRQGDAINITMYYDTARADTPAPPADEFFINNLSTNLSAGDRLGIIFDVPNKAGLAAVGVDLGIGREGEMFLPAPLLTAGRNN